MYSLSDYIAAVGGQYSFLITVISFFAQKFLYPAIIKDLGDELKDHEIEDAEQMNSKSLERNLN
jgi:hypothetical protein